MSKRDIDNKELTDKKINEQDVSVYAYDRAIVQDLRARFHNTSVNDTVQISPTDQVFNILGNINDDQVVMPFVSLERIDWQLNLDRQGFQTFVGDKVYKRKDPSGNTVEVRAQVIPITINYKLSVWTTDRLTNDALVRELLFYYHIRPSLLVKVTHGINMLHKFNIYFNSGIEDNSDIANHINNGTYFRQDLTFYVDDAYLWKANWQNLVEINPGLTFYYE